MAKQSRKEPSKKEQTLLALFDQCKKSGIFDFDNKIVKRISMQTDFRNHNDATKLDHSKILPDAIRDEGYCVAHLGCGQHQFIKALNYWYHDFESIEDTEKTDWPYKPSLLNNTDASESNVISLAYNQRILHHFLYQDISVEPRIYMSRRTKISTSYRVGAREMKAEKLQVEMDATFEHHGNVAVLEAKNGSPEDFAVYQIFLPFLDYHLKGLDGVKSIKCCYLLRCRTKRSDSIRLYLYSFENPEDLGSIQLERKAEYLLLVRGGGGA